MDVLNLFKFKLKILKKTRCSVFVQVLVQEKSIKSIHKHAQKKLIRNFIVLART